MTNDIQETLHEKALDVLFNKPVNPEIEHCLNDVEVTIKCFEKTIDECQSDLHLLKNLLEKLRKEIGGDKQ